ncbi:hypothetical protein ACLX1H_009205 [Fusarium chlamydosporum]
MTIAVYETGSDRWSESSYDSDLYETGKKSKRASGFTPLPESTNDSGSTVDWLHPVPTPATDEEDSQTNSKKKINVRKEEDAMDTEHWHPFREFIKG